MKADLATAIVAAVAGTVISFFLCNLLTGEISDVSVKTIETDVSADIDEPSPEVFNYKALNPTVEVYVGNCDGQYNEAGECVEETNSEETP